jgi:hypothetical protein
MSKKAQGTVIQYGNSIYIPIVSDIVNDSLYPEINIQKGDKVEIEIFGTSLRISKAEQNEE